MSLPSLNHWYFGTGKPVISQRIRKFSPLYLVTFFMASSNWTIPAENRENKVHYFMVSVIKTAVLDPSRDTFCAYAIILSCGGGTGGWLEPFLVRWDL